MNREKYEKALAFGREAGLFVMRAGVGLSFLYIHGFPKMTAGTELWVKLGAAMGNLGIHFAPAFWGFMSASAEFFGGACLVLGQGLETASHAIEDMFLFAGLVLTGGGHYSLDQLLFKGKF